MMQGQRTKRYQGDQKLKVLWVTNLAAPYRIPVWQHLARGQELTVALLESNVGLLRDAAANRGQDWTHQPSDKFVFAELPTWKLSRGESRFYFLKGYRTAKSVRQYDVVLFGGWESPAYWTLLLACIITGTARVAFYESTQQTMTHKSGLISFLRAGFFRCMNRIVVPGGSAHDAVTGTGIQRDKIHEGFNAVDVSAFYEAALSACSRPGDDGQIGHRYLYVGQLIERKRIQEIVQAFIQVRRPNDELTIVGTGELLPDLTDLANASSARISFLGSVKNSDLPLIMALQNTLILASRREVWGLVVNEALASGMHVVTTENCGVAQSVSGMRGVYVAKESLEDLAEKIQLSRTAWVGRVSNPKILEYTPARFAAVFEDAFIAAHEAVLAKKSTRKQSYGISF